MNEINETNLIHSDNLIHAWVESFVPLLPVLMCFICCHTVISLTTLLVIANWC